MKYKRFGYGICEVVNFMIMDGSYNSDAHSSCGENNLRGEEIQLKKFIKSMLVTCLFVGTFVEKRFVASINEYRHIIKVNDAEIDFINHLKVSKKKLKKYYGEMKWIGITNELSLGSPVGNNIWTELKEEKFGTYWFKVKAVEFHHNEIKLRVKAIRQYLRESDIDTSVKDSTQCVNYSFELLVARLYTSFGYFFTDVLSARNLYDVFVFMVLLLVSVLAGSFKIIHYILEYFLKLTKILNESIVALTPTFIALINVISSVVLGFFKLIAYVFTQRNQTTSMVVVSQDNMRYIVSSRPPAYQGNAYRRSIGGVQIREIR